MALLWLLFRIMLHMIFPCWPFIYVLSCLLLQDNGAGERDDEVLDLHIAHFILFIKNGVEKKDRLTMVIGKGGWGFENIC